ncbi:MAG: type IV pilin, partial [Thermoplasmatales archaeon]
MKTKRGDKAVSEIMGTVLLLALAVGLFSTVYVFVINQSLNPEEHAPPVNLVGTTEGKTIVFENRGGLSLPSDSIICFLSVAGKQMNMTIGPYLQDTNGNGAWDVGEKLVFNSSNIGVDITDLQVDAAIIDKSSDQLVMSGTIQEGEVYEYPYVRTIDPTNIESDRAKLWMDYNFRSYTGNLSFAYKAAGGDWNYTTWLVGQSGEGSYGVTVTGLIPESIYFFKARLQYDNETIEDVVKSFTTLGIVVGMWHFDTGSGTIAFDSSGRDNHGTLYYGPQWITGVNGTTALSYDGIDDYVEVPDDPSLDITDEITIEAWMKPLENSEGYYGQIKSSILDSSYFGVFNIYEPDIIHVSGNIYAIACRGDSNDGFLITVEIANDGQINLVVIDTLEFYTGDCFDPDIIHVNGTIYAIAYRSGWTAYVRTVEIFNDGRINPATINTLAFATTYRETHIYHINGDVFAVAYTGPSYDGYLTSMGIASNGQITGVIDTLVFDNSLAGVVEEPNMVHVSGDVYAIAYRNADSDGEVRTVNISSGGLITAPSFFDGDYIDNFAFDIFDGFEANITHINGNIYAIAYGGFNSDGMLRTITIYNDGTIKQDTVDALEFDVNFGREPDIIHINGDIYAIVYRGPGDDGWLVTVDIANDGTITSSVVDSYEFDTSTCYDPNIIHINGNIYAIAYRGIYDDGLLKTVEIAIDGTISKPVIDYSEFGIFDCQQPDIIQISNDIYAMAYRGLYYDGYLRTIKIASDGQIYDNTINGLRFHKGQIWDPMIIHISGDVYAIAYSNYSTSWHGFLKTVRIASDGNITGGVIDTLEFDTSQGLWPDIVHVSGDVYAIAYCGPSNDGYVKTVRIASDGTFPVAGVDSKEFDTSNCYYPDIIHTSGDVYAIAYCGPSNDGYVKTVEIAIDGTITTSGMDTLEFDTSYCVFPNIINVEGDIYSIAYTGPS